MNVNACNEVGCNREANYRLMLRYGKSMNLIWFCEFHKQEFDRTTSIKIEVQNLNDVKFYDSYSVNLPISSKLSAN